jgi:1-acyl-sn-glycerol-3-phosphate acyltransferase
MVLRFLGWRLHGAISPEMQKAVVIAAPHTSNWDLPYSLMAGFGLGLQAHWLGKASLFRFPFKGLMRWLGGIGVERSRPGQLVAAAVDCFKQAQGPLFLMIPPEGTRSKVREWKTGFYYIAQGANVPIILAYMDHAKKEAGFGPCLEVTGNLEADMATMKAFYAPIQGLKPDQFDASR